MSDLPILLPYQQKWVTDASPVKVCVKSRRVGITWASAFEATLLAATDRSAGGRDVWYQTYADDDAKEFIIDATRWARMLGMTFAEEFRVINEDDPGDADEWCLLPEGQASVRISSLRFNSGFRVSALPAPPRKLRGKDGYYILDEADSHADLIGALHAANAFRTWGGRVAIISTQGDVDGEFNRLVQDIKGGRGARGNYSLHEITLLDAVRDGLYKRVCEVDANAPEWSEEAEQAWVDDLLSTEGAETEFMCVPRRAGGQYIPRALVEPCQADYPVARFKPEAGFMQLDEPTRDRVIDQWCRDVVAPLVRRLPERRPHYLGEDFGRSSDMTVLAPGYEAQDMTLEVPFMLELEDVPYESQKRVVFFLLERMNIAHAAFDATGNGAYLAEQALLRWGATVVEAVSITLPWYAETLPKLRARFQDARIRVPRDLDVLTDLGKFEVIDGVPRLPKRRTNAKTYKGKRHGDAGVALACLVHAVGTPAPANRYERVPKRGGHFSREGIL